MMLTVSPDTGSSTLGAAVSNTLPKYHGAAPASAPLEPPFCDASMKKSPDPAGVEEGEMLEVVAAVVEAADVVASETVSSTEGSSKGRVLASTVVAVVEKVGEIDEPGEGGWGGKGEREEESGEEGDEGGEG